ncbi:DNA polymerase III subunit delta' C-terminal domain-containing protein [Buchnera aphidicola (Ceratoglyphina bambusae)]|uniref:DNA polymerase III subunit delta' C-terminal domain-containing protein n=1 Tax=Buchnera aphidicola TaxID=9 RepID=UPI0031B87C70
MKYNLYPWLKKYYKKIVNILKNNNHHAILINSSENIGIHKLILYIKYWISCDKKIKKNFCNKCLNCILIRKCVHPDIYDFQLHKKLGVVKIRKIIKKIFNTPHQGNKKIICIKNAELLTELESNVLLKTIEEPPKNTIFILQTYKIKNLILTLKSRLYILNIFNPKKKIVINWLKENKILNKKKYNIALKISNNSPMYTKKILCSDLLKIRKQFYKDFLKILINKNIISFIYIIKKSILSFLIYLIYTIFLDTIKYKKKIFSHITNTDQKKLIKFISKNLKNKNIYNSIKSWMQFEKNIKEINGINYDLIILEQILKWNQILKNNINNPLLPEI